MSSPQSKTRWRVFPRTACASETLRKVADAFTNNEHRFIAKKKAAKGKNGESWGLESNEVLKILKGELEAVGFSVEKSKKASDKKKLAVTYGENDSAEKTFDVDAYHAHEQIILEVEAGRGFANNAVFLDFLKGCALQDINHIVIACRLDYRGTADFEEVCRIVDSLYASSRMHFPIKSLLVIGYPVSIAIDQKRARLRSGR